MSVTVALGAAPEAAREGEVDVEAREEAAGPNVGQVQEEQQEQKVTEETKEEGALDSQTLTPALSQREREQKRIAERIRASSVLPPGLRTRLAELVESGGSAEAIEGAVRAVEQSLPWALRASRDGLLRPAHPAGDAFFSGNGQDISEDEAEQIAWHQLQRSGLLRGQRVRVGD